MRRRDFLRVSAGTKWLTLGSGAWVPSGVWLELKVA